MWQQNQRRWPKDRLCSEFCTFRIPTHYTVVKRGLNLYAKKDPIFEVPEGWKDGRADRGVNVKLLV